MTTNKLTGSYGVNPKFITHKIETIDGIHARFLIRLQYDELRQQEFFNGIIEGYINGDEHIFNFIQEYKDKVGRQRKIRLTKTRKINTKQKEVSKVFGLDENEIEDLFDQFDEEDLPEM